MVVLGKVERKELIDIYAIAVPAVVNIGLFCAGRLIDKVRGRRETEGPLGEWRRESLGTRIFLHRVAATVTICLVMWLVWIMSPETVFIGKLLWGMLFVEVYLFGWYLIPRAGGEREERNEAGWVDVIGLYIKELVDLRYRGTEYPVASLVVEALVVTYLCAVSGGISSPFISLFVYFCALALYVSFSWQFTRIVTYVVALCCCFVAIVNLGDMEGSVLGMGVAIPEAFAVQVPEEKGYAVHIVFFYSTVMCGLLFLGIMRHSARQATERVQVCVEQAKNVLDANDVRNYRIIDEGGRVFLIGDSAPLNAEKTLALLPYCSRSRECAIRRENRLRGVNEPINGGQCRHCKNMCPVGRMIDCRIGDKYIAGVEVIGTGHNVEQVIEGFCSSHELRHVIAVCCTPNFAKYVKKYKDAKYKGVALVYTPLLSGTETCLSAVDIAQNRRAVGKLPFTTFDVEGLIGSLSVLAEGSNDQQEQGAGG